MKRILHFWPQRKIVIKLLRAGGVDLSGYAKLTDIPDISGKVDTTTFQAALEKAGQELATTTTQAQVQTIALGVIENGSY